MRIVSNTHSQRVFYENKIEMIEKITSNIQPLYISSTFMKKLYFSGVLFLRTCCIEIKQFLFVRTSIHIPKVLQKYALRFELAQ